MAGDPGEVVVMWNVVMVIAIVIAAGLGWFVASRRHPGYVIAFSLLLLGSAGLVIATLPSLLMGAALTADDPWAIVVGQGQANRVVGSAGATAVAFAVVAGARALWVAPRDALTSETPASAQSSASRAGSRS